MENLLRHLSRKICSSAKVSVAVVKENMTGKLGNPLHKQMPLRGTSSRITFYTRTRKMIEFS